MKGEGVCLKNLISTRSNPEWSDMEKDRSCHKRSIRGLPKPSLLFVDTSSFNFLFCSATTGELSVAGMMTFIKELLDRLVPLSCLICLNLHRMVSASFICFMMDTFFMFHSLAFAVTRSSKNLFHFLDDNRFVFLPCHMRGLTLLENFIRFVVQCIEWDFFLEFFGVGLVH